MFIDIHSHILPKIDDGAKDPKESLRLLLTLKSQGVGAVALTPHFYPRVVTDFDRYIQKITEAFTKLKEIAPHEYYPQLFLGSEVHLFEGAASFSEIELLAINRSKLILIEFPYRNISSKLIDEVIALNLDRGLQPVLVHIERYCQFDGYDKLLNLISEGYAVGQVNSSSFCNLSQRRTVIKLLKNGYANCIASDTHSLTVKSPKFTDAFSYINKKLGPEYADLLKVNSDRQYNLISGVINIEVDN